MEKLQEIMGKVWELFYSSKLTVLLFLILAFASVVGTLIPQNADPSLYIKNYGFRTFQWLEKFSLTDLYHSLWFRFILLLMIINILFCISRSIPKKFRLLKEEERNVSKKFISHLKLNQKIQGFQRIDITKEMVKKLFRRKGYKIQGDSLGSEVSLTMSKGTLGRFGSDITHFSILVILLGAITGNIWGFKDFLAINEGESKFIEKAGFWLKLEDFKVEYYDETGNPKDYFSTLTVIDGGKKVLQKTIEVNDPLRYKRVWFYQSSYGLSWDKVKKVNLRIEEKNTRQTKGKFTIPFQEEFPINDLGVKIKVARFISDFSIDAQTRTVFSRSTEPNNPAIQLEVYQLNKLISTPWVFLHYPDIHLDEKLPYYFQFLDYMPIEYSGLQVAKDPGVNIVWLGCLIMVVGLTISFTISQKKVWAKLIEDKDNCIIYIGGRASKSPYSFQREFHNMTEYLQKTMVKGGIKDV